MDKNNLEPTMVPASIKISQTSTLRKRCCTSPLAHMDVYEDAAFGICAFITVFSIAIIGTSGSVLHSVHTAHEAVDTKPTTAFMSSGIVVLIFNVASLLAAGVSHCVAQVYPSLLLLCRNILMDTDESSSHRSREYHVFLRSRGAHCVGCCARNL